MRTFHAPCDAQADGRFLAGARFGTRIWPKQELSRLSVIAPESQSVPYHARRNGPNKDLVLLELNASARAFVKVSA
jgi:hypothetical protein